LSSGLGIYDMTIESAVVIEGILILGLPDAGNQALLRLIVVVASDLAG